jgi:putative colanic acid biosynthesis UDP-glucose lipid carrier transferase
LAFSFASGMCLMVASRVGLAAMVDRLADRLAERVLIVGRSAATERLLDQQSQMPERPRVVGQILVGEGQPSVPLVGRLYPNAVSQTPVSYPIQGIDRIIILRDGLDDAQLGSITKQLEALHLPVHVLMDLPGVSGASGALDNVGWVLRERPMTPTAMIAKRALDLLVCCLALLFLAPLMLLVGLLVRLDSPGPALFRQTRLGRSNQPFTVYKFRTMRVDAHATDGSVQAVRGDVRVTRVGAFLRKTSIDELPQLLNVLNGTMSLVGPRPHPTELNKKFMPLIDSYAARHRIAPGITGWAQVNGFRGETRTVEQMQRRVELDLEYIRDRSVAFDLWILLRTVVSVFAHRNAAY